MVGSAEVRCPHRSARQAAGKAHARGRERILMVSNDLEFASLPPSQSWLTGASKSQPI